MASDAAFMDKLTALCKRRGFIFQSSEIYGGIGGFWDYGPLGVELKRNIKEAWWRDFVMNPPLGPDGKEIQMVGLDCSIIMNPKVWEASGHLAGFADPMRKCAGCGHFVRADQLQEALAVGSKWVDSLIQEFTPITGEIDTPRLMKWAKSKGKALAPNLALVREPEVTLSWLATRVNGQPTAPPELREIISYLATEQLHQTGLQDPCPRCGGPLGEAAPFKLMFESYAGVEQTPESKVYLRPETAQGIFANYKNVLDTARVKVPFGIAQIGKAFRNEITPRNYTFRSREFEQMEIEFFCREEESMDWYQFWRNHRFNWYVGLGLKSEKLRLRDQTKEELAHYSKACADIEYLFPFSDEHQELEGVAHRGNFDLTQHQTHSGKDLTYFEETKWSEFLAERKAKGLPELTKDEKSELGAKPPYRYLPTVIEPSAGADRATLAFLCEAYTEDQKADAKGVMQTRVYMKFHPRLAPIKAAFFPLVNKEGMPELAEKLYRDAKKHMNVFYDDGGSIGKRYARMDEAGTPFCITIDGDTIKSDGENAGMVTIRDRDTLEQIRVHRDQVVAWLRERMGQA
ncbi:MAG: glycine--tRNA ligase [Phycisphaerales bacterium]|nr:glycine--tRNA ligase [Phycisphaerales bacterium]